MQYKKIILSFLVFVNAFATSYAQRAEIGLNGGGSGYIGEFNQSNPLKISGINGGIYAKINFDPHWGLGLHYNYGRIKGDDATSKNPVLQQRNLNFRTSLNEVAFIGSFNFIDMYSPGSKKRISPYLFLGVGGVLFEPRGKYLGEWGVTLADTSTSTEGLAPYRKYSLVMPFGAGLKYKKSENWTLFGQIGYRAAFTDYLDDVSGVYPDKPKMWGGVNISDRSGEVSASRLPIYSPGDQRGDSRKRDTYVFVNIGISYTFVSQKCFTF
jgi:opacity protein-like surface antigen